ncbi:MAG: 6,7-dimethyl-8-ribityllumazine synthase, partial [Janthinobacterium lividum]
MIKGMTVVQPVSGPDELQKLAGLLGAIGFEQGKGWNQQGDQGLAFLAPLGNLELVTGQMPATPRLLIEVSQLDHVRSAVIRTLGEEPVSQVEDTHWQSRMFTVRLADGLEAGFWEFDLPVQVPAIEGELSAAGMKFAIVTTRWNTVITDRLLQGALDCLLRSGAKRADITVVRVPGAWEIPNAARTL